MLETVMNVAQKGRPGKDALATTENMQRMAKDMGIKFQASRPVSLGPQPSSLHIKRSAPAAGSINSPKRPRTAREQFIEAERQRKTARMAPVEADSDEDDYDPSGDEEDVDDGPSHSSIRDQIWQLLGRNRQQYMSRDDDSDDDMEAGANEVFREEQRSAHVARREDEREEKMLQEERRRKMLA